MNRLKFSYSESANSNARQKLFTCMFLITLGGLYFQFHLYSGRNIVFPFPISNFMGLLFLVFFSKRADGINALYLALSFVIFSSPYLIWAVEGGYFSAALSKHLQLITSLMAGYGLYTLLLELPKSYLEMVLRRLAVGILIVATLEVYLGVRPIMLAINSVLYSWRPDGFYLSETRDLQLWGIVRPLVFSTEPSLVGIWGTSLMIASSVLNPKTGPRRNLALIGYVVALLFVTKSTTSLIILTFHLIGGVFYGRRKFMEVFAPSFAFFSLGVVIFLSGFATLLLQYTQNTSFFARITAPYLSAVEVFRFSPFFGLGAGNDLALQGVVFEVWGRNGMLARSFDYVDLWGIDGMLTNNFFWIWIYFGILGGVTFLSIILALLRRTGRQPIIPLALSILGVWSSMGGFVDLRSWFFVFLLAACFNTLEKTKNGR